ncbi:hypothetical protein C7999DRAFT_41869 [Corynascus novoguineensis]|uniref:AB hydrolase-1 domain-containing protein n=1 Tax=Corynascus novoguineensis TaxID=1126955 RepID=A0AAN7CTR8_9PEZI|nr:hypothetical protein C7999DRAFT_41869 [Corynascus novoguineensis]
MGSLVVSLVFEALAVKEGGAAPTTSQRPCVQLEIPVSIDTTATKWLQLRVDSNIDVPNITERMIGKVTVKDPFKIDGQLCAPPKDKIVIRTRSANGQDNANRYWDVEVKPDEYSYLEAALARGYAVFTYDRLGTGGSDKPDAYDVVQTSVQVEVLRQLTSLARSGNLVGGSEGSRALNGIPLRLANYKPSKIVHVGHSLGSAITLGLIGSADDRNHDDEAPPLSDGVVSTGFLHTTPADLAGVNVAAWGLELAREHDPVRFGDRGSGYVVQSTKGHLQLRYLGEKGAFEEGLLDYAWAVLRQPASVSEFISVGTAFGRGAAGFKGPLQFVIGEKDYDFCAGDCRGAYDVDTIKENYYPGATALEVYLQPETGHALTLSKNATAGYDVAFDFLHRVGL